MRISGNEPSSANFIQTKKVTNLKSYTPKVPKQAKAKREGVINPWNYNFNQFLTRKFWSSQNATNQPKFPHMHCWI